MRTCLYFAILLALFVAGSAYAAQVTSIDLKYVNGGAIAHIGVQGTFQFTHKIEPPKDGRRDRLIIDVLDATHNWGPKGWSTLPVCGVQNVRIGQYSSKPDKVVRVVFDLEKAPVYRVDATDKGIDVYFTDNTVKPFTAWTTGPAPSAPPVIPPPVATAATAAPADKPTTVATTTPTPATTVPTSVKPVETTPAANHTMLASTTPTVAPTTAPTPTASTPAPKAKEGVPTVTMSKPVVLQPGPPKAAPTVVKPTVAPATPAGTQAVKPTTTPKPEVVPANTTVAAKPTPSAPQPDAKAPVVSTPATPTAAPVVTAPIETSPTAKAPAVATTTEAPAVPASSDSPVVADAGTPTDGSTSGSVRPTARFRRSANARIKSSLVAEFPQRLVIKYESAGNRDPFATLIDDSRTYDTPLEQRVPNIDGLKLVGIIESPTADNRALFEDKNHFSYILSSGDKIQRGYVLRVEDDRVFFQIFEYGWSRTIALTLENRE